MPVLPSRYAFFKYLVPLSAEAGNDPRSSPEGKGHLNRLNVCRDNKPGRLRYSLHRIQAPKLQTRLLSFQLAPLRVTPFAAQQGKYAGRSMTELLLEPQLRGRRRAGRFSPGGGSTGPRDDPYRTGRRDTATRRYNPRVTQDQASADGFSFDLHASDGPARRATWTTPHGAIETPAFVAVGTRASIKGVSSAQVAETGTQVIFNNTYHLFLRPGSETVSDMGGLHRFMNWDRPIMTDSGGFQVFSLGAGIEHGVGKISNIFPGETPARGERRGKPGESLVKVTEEGVRFVSHIDGSRHEFTPEVSIAVQRELGADMILAFDECTSPLHDEEYTRASMERTHRWAQRSLDAFRGSAALHGYPQALYGIVQGGAFEGLRRQSAAVIAGMEFDGIAIGGNLGRTHDDMHAVIDWTVAELPAGKPRHLLGIGDVPGVIEGVARGCDTFDCVSPTRNARNGAALRRFDDDGGPLANFRVNLRNAHFARDERPIDPGCDCHACQYYSRGYIRHLLKAGEQLGQQLATIHNLRFMARLMEDIRASLEAGTFQQLRREWLG